MPAHDAAPPIARDPSAESRLLFRGEAGRAVIRRARAGVLTSVVAVSLAWMSASACHRAVAPAAHTRPAPAVRAIAATAPTLTDRQWIDSVAQSWAARPSTSVESSGVRPATARAVSPSASAVASIEPTTSTTSYAEAGALQAPPETDDRTPLIVFCAIGGVAFVIAAASARVAFGA